MVRIIGNDRSGSEAFEALRSLGSAPPSSIESTIPSFLKPFWRMPITRPTTIRRCERVPTLCPRPTTREGSREAGRANTNWCGSSSDIARADQDQFLCRAGKYSGKRDLRANTRCSSPRVADGLHQKQPATGGAMPPTQRPLRLEAAILSRMRSEVTSRSNWREPWFDRSRAFFFPRASPLAAPSELGSLKH